MAGSAPQRRYRRHGVNTRGTMFGQPEPHVNVQAASVARRFARCDRRSNPLHCYRTRKLMYDSREIARSTGQQLERITGQAYWLYPCPPGTTKHFHLSTTPPAVEGVGDRERA